MSSTRSKSLKAGAISGFTVDLALYPIDTLKTRLQSSRVYEITAQNSAVFRRIYSGLPAALIGSAPSAAMFFLSYEFTKELLQSGENGIVFSSSSLIMIASAAGELSACTVRVPFELVKQRVQDSRGASTRAILFQTLRAEKFPANLYRGYFSTVLREIPFSFIQFPIWEKLRQYFQSRNPPAEIGSPPKLDMWASCACGFIAGGAAAALTTPLDVVKTRVMLVASSSSDLKQRHSPYRGRVINAIKQIASEPRGWRGFFAGIAPRTLQISMGGAIFLGIYDILMSRL